MQLKKTLRLYRNLIITSAWAALAILGILFGVVPLVQKTVSLASDVGALSAEIDLLRSKAGILQLLDEETLRKNVIALSAAVPVDKSLASILTTVDTVSGQTSVAISDVSLIKPGSIATESAKKLTSEETKIGSSLQPFTVSGRGSFEEIKLFLSSIVAVRRMFRLRSMDISMRNELANVRLDLDAFYFPYPKTVGSVHAVASLTPEEENTIAAVSALPLASVTSVSTISASLPSGKDDPFTP